MINYDENEAENEKKDHIDTTYIELDQDMAANIKYKMCLSVMMVMCNKQHLSNI